MCTISLSNWAYDETELKVREAESESINGTTPYNYNWIYYNSYASVIARSVNTNTSENEGKYLNL